MSAELKLVLRIARINRTKDRLVLRRIARVSTLKIYRGEIMFNNIPKEISDRMEYFLKMMRS
jgi:hypothetical protein